MKKSTALFRSITTWFCFTVFALGICITSVNADTNVERWGVFELKLDGPDHTSAYIDVTIAATFTRGNTTIEVPGFYDGGGTYMVRFSPPTIGSWTYSTKSNRDALNGKSGSFHCVTPSLENHGPVQIVNTYYLQYADGTPYYGIGTTAYQWTSVEKDLQEKTLETLAESPFNKMRMCVFPKWYRHGNSTEPWAYAYKRNGKENDYTQPNYEFFRNFDLRVRQLGEMGIEADVILFHSYDNWGYEKMGKENDDRFLRYMIARLSAYRNVWWSLANEYDLMIKNEDKTMDDFDRFFQILQNEDPHQRLRGNHNWYYSEDHFYDHTKPWVTHASLQTYHFWDLIRWRNLYQKPILVDEMRYEGDVSSGWGKLTPDEMTSYFWMAGLSGAYPTHGDTYDNRSGEGETRWWAKGGTLPGKSVPRIAFFKRIMEQAPVTEMSPTIVMGGEGSTDTINNNIYMFSKPGQYYLAYTASAGKTIEFDLPEGTRYSVDLIDVQNLTIKQLPNAAPGQFSFTTPNEYCALRVIAGAGMSNPHKKTVKANQPFHLWLNDYIAENIPEAKLTNHGGWLQAHIPGLVASWAIWNEEGVVLKDVHDVEEGESLFISKDKKENWTESDSVIYFEGVGYYITGYTAATMSEWDVENSTVVQFDGDSKQFAETMANVRAGMSNAHKKTVMANQPFHLWLNDYIAENIPEAKLTNHGGWLQAHIPGLVASWAIWNEEGVVLKDVHDVEEGESLFISKDKKENWTESESVIYFEGVGYYITGYTAATMSEWDVENSTVVQFDGDSKQFAETMANVRKDVK